jgi:hypothetical protein
VRTDWDRSSEDFVCTILSKILFCCFNLFSYSCSWRFIFNWRDSFKLSVWDIIWCMWDKFEAWPELYLLGLFGKVLFFSWTRCIESDLIPKIKFLLFIIERGILSFLFLFSLPILIMFIIAA